MKLENIRFLPKLNDNLELWDALFASFIILILSVVGISILGFVGYWIVIGLIYTWPYSTLIVTGALALIWILLIAGILAVNRGWFY